MKDISTETRLVKELLAKSNSHPCFLGEIIIRNKPVGDEATRLLFVAKSNGNVVFVFAKIDLSKDVGAACVTLTKYYASTICRPFSVQEYGKKIYNSTDLTRLREFSYSYVTLPPANKGGEQNYPDDSDVAVVCNGNTQHRKFGELQADHAINYLRIHELVVTANVQRIIIKTMPNNKARINESLENAVEKIPAEVLKKFPKALRESVHTSAPSLKFKEPKAKLAVAISSKALSQAKA